MKIRFAIMLTLCVTVLPIVANTQSESATPAARFVHHKSAATTYTRGTASMQQFKSEADARGVCDNGNVAWMNTRNDVLHFPGDGYYGKTKHGAYVCTKKQ